MAEVAYNKIYILHMNTGEELVARIPHPIAGPPSTVISSEVATTDYARTVLNMPVPRVLSWSASNTHIRSAYILAEKVQGVIYRERLETANAMNFTPVIEGLLETDKQCLKAVLSQFGSLYYKEDVSLELQDCPLYAEDSEIENGADRFRIGLIAGLEFWRGERATLNVDRGPWFHPSEYLTAVALCERTWIGKYAKPDRPRPSNDLELTSDPPSAHVDLLDRYIRVMNAPGIAPTDFDVFRPTLEHPDLNDGNLIVTPGPDVLIHVHCIIDWQHSCIIPACMTHTAPLALVYRDQHIDLDLESISTPQLPANFDTLTEELKEVVQWERELATLHKKYLLRVLEHPIRLQSFVPHFAIACPIGFSEDERKEILDMKEDLEVWEAHFEALQEELSCDDDGQLIGASEEEVQDAGLKCVEWAEKGDEKEARGSFPFYPGSPAFITTFS